MKKKVLFLILLLLPFIVSAEKFNVEFESEKVYSNTTFNLFYKDGFLFIDSNHSLDNGDNTTMFRLYNEKGELVKSNIIDEEVGASKVLTDGEYIYLLGRRDGSERLFKIDENFELVKIFNPHTLTGYGDLFIRTDHFELKDDKFLVSVYDYSDGKNKIIELDKNFENISVKSVDTLEGINYYNQYDVIDLDSSGNIHPIEYIKYDGGYLVSLKEYKNCNSDGCDVIAHLRKIDNDYNTVWEKTFTQYKELRSMTIFENKIYLIAYNKNGWELSDGDLIVLNDEGEEIESLLKGKAIIGININKKHVILSTGKYGFCFTTQSFTEPNDCRSETYHTVYSIEYDIIPKVTGKGTINVVSSSFSNRGITFEVVPEKGYTLGEVKVTDVNGNVITFTDYKFTMPDANVLIEVAFVPDNPNTGVFISYIAIVIGGIALITTYLLIQKKNALKRVY